MKYLLLLTFIILSLGSCKKCATCTTVYTQTTTGQQPVTSTSTTELCGSDLKEADGNETVATSTVSGFTSTIRTKTNCK